MILLKLYAESLTPTGVNEVSQVTSDKYDVPLCTVHALQFVTICTKCICILYVVDVHTEVFVQLCCA